MKMARIWIKIKINNRSFQPAEQKNTDKNENTTVAKNHL